jgi:hypothetical protein
MPSISFQPTLEDVLAATRLHYSASLKTGRMVRAYLLGSALCAVAGLALAWLFDLSLILTALAGAVLWPVFLSLVLLAGYLRVPGQARRTYARQKSLQGDITVTWSDTGISTKSIHGRSRFAWADFIAIVDGADAILLSETDTQFTFIPKRVLSDEQVASILQYGNGAGPPVFEPMKSFPADP